MFACTLLERMCGSSPIRMFGIATLGPRHWLATQAQRSRTAMSSTMRGLTCSAGCVPADVAVAADGSAKALKKPMAITDRAELPLHTKMTRWGSTCLPLARLDEQRAGRNAATRALFFGMTSA